MALAVIDITKNVIYISLVDKNDFALFVSSRDTCAMEMGKIIKRLREGRGWSQDELAFRTGTSTANISRIENGRHSAGQKLLGALAREFDYKVYQLVALAEGVENPIVPTISNPDEEALLSVYRAMTEEQKRLFSAVGGQFVGMGKVSQENFSDTPTS